MVKLVTIAEFASMLEANEELVFDGDSKALFMYSYYADGSKSLMMIWSVL